MSARALLRTALLATLTVAGGCDGTQAPPPLFEGARPIALDSAQQGKPLTSQEVERLVAALLEVAGGPGGAERLRKLRWRRVEELYHAVRTVLTEWTDRLTTETGDAFPEHVTAFRPEMAVHGRFGKPCPRCGSPVQRIAYASNECNYCATCQTDGRLLADRTLSRLLREDWPKTLEELEELKDKAGRP